MKIKELQKKITCLEAKLAEVKEMAEAMKKRADGGVFKPEDGQEYWCLISTGEVTEEWWYDNPFDHDRYAIGNCFPTEQVGEDAVRVLKLIRRAREAQDGFVPDWKDFEQNKYQVYFDSGEIHVANLHTANMAPIFGYWEDESVCEQFIRDNHDELIWFFTEYRR